MRRPGQRIAPWKRMQRRPHHPPGIPGFHSAQPGLRAKQARWGEERPSSQTPSRGVFRVLEERPTARALRLWQPRLGIRRSAKNRQRACQPRRQTLAPLPRVAGIFHPPSNRQRTKAGRLSIVLIQVMPIYPPAGSACDAFRDRSYGRSITGTKVVRPPLRGRRQGAPALRVPRTGQKL